MRAHALLPVLASLAPQRTPLAFFTASLAPQEQVQEAFQIPDNAPAATGTLLGAITLVAGTTIGAGILALPAKTFPAGFGPSALTLLGCWVYMSSSGLLLAEVNVNTLCALEKDAVSIDSMAEATLGEAGARISGAAYVFIHYALLIAYMLQGGQLLLEYLDMSGVAPGLPTPVGPSLFAALAGGAVFAGSERQIESGNNLLFGGVLVSFFALLALGVPNVDLANLARADVPAVVPAVPVMVLSLVFHNVVPTICYQLGCDLNRIRTAILVGSAIPTLMFILWNLVILGSVPPEAAEAAKQAAAAAQAAGTSVSDIFDPLQGLRASGDAFGQVVRAFSLLAIVTSFIGFVLGLNDYFADLLAGPLGIDATAAPSSDAAATTAAGGGGGGAGGGGKDASGADDAQGSSSSSSSAARFTPLQRAALFSCSLLPPLGVALYDPSLFFAALDNAGTFGILTLFGMVPAAMAWESRYGEGSTLPGEGENAVPAVLPGGRATLGVMGFGAAAIVALESYEKLTGVVL